MYTKKETEILNQASSLVAKHFLRKDIRQVTSPNILRDHLKYTLAWQSSEKFMVYFLDSQHHVITFEILFHGTIDSASVYPREIFKRSLELNAAAIILAHNHPSGCSDPSEADKNLTYKIVKAGELIGVRVIDHMVVGSDDTYSFSESGLI